MDEISYFIISKLMFSTSYWMEFIIAVLLSLLNNFAYRYILFKKNQTILQGNIAHATIKDIIPVGATMCVIK